MKKGYLLLEAVNLDNFISDTKDLNTIRGASLLLLNAMEEIPHKLKRLNLTPIATGASIGLYAFNADNDEVVRQIANHVLAWLRANPRSQHATFTLTARFAEKGETFELILKKISAQSRWQQMKSPTVVIRSAIATQPCALDLVRPATRAVPAPENDFHLVSESVAVRRLAGQKLKQHFYQRQIGKQIKRQFVRELKELTKDEHKGSLSEKMAVIYLDGNGFGRIKNSVCRSHDMYRDFDQTVKSYRREMLEGLLDRMEVDGDWQTREGKYRIETLLWGGDELMWIVPAWKGWETLQYFYQQSERWQFNEYPLRHSAGLVFCHHNAPIHRITSLARNLAELAKDKSRADNLFAYEVLESFDHVGRDLGKYRGERCPQPLTSTDALDPQTLILDGAMMATLENFVYSYAEELPRKQLHELTDELLTPLRVDDLPAKRESKRKELLDRLQIAATKAGKPKDGLQELFDSFGEQNFWLHVNALWDYLM